MFEWDADKALANLKERRVDFWRASMIFRNAVIESIDERNDYGEQRVVALGNVENEYYVVVYTRRGENRRIISAWRAGDETRRKYRKLHDAGNYRTE